MKNAVKLKKKKKIFLLPTAGFTSCDVTRTAEKIATNALGKTATEE